jgi:hypothetical protein
VGVDIFANYYAPCIGYMLHEMIQLQMSKREITISHLVDLKLEKAPPPRNKSQQNNDQLSKKGRKEVLSEV